MNDGRDTPKMTEFERALIASTTSDGPRPEARVAALAAVTAAAALGTVATSGAMAGSATATKALVFKWIVFIGLGTTVVTGAAVVALRSTAEKTSLAPALPSSVPAPAAATMVVASTETTEPFPGVAFDSLPAVPSTVPSIQNGAPPPQRSSAAQPSSGSLADEILQLRRAERALKAGDAAGAITELLAYEARFPNGALADEASALHISAEADAGNTRAALARAERFLKAHPSSPQAARVQALVQRLNAK